MRTFGIALALVAGLTLAACSSSKKSANSPPAPTSSTTSSAATSTSPSFDQAAAQAEIKKNWEAFFSKNTPVANKVAYLQGGQSHQAMVQHFANDPRTKQASAKVTSVSVTSPSQATVNYQVLLNGTVALPSAVGTAVNENGVWKVSDSTMCGLFGLMGGAKVPGC